MSHAKAYACYLCGSSYDTASALFLHGALAHAKQTTCDESTCPGCRLRCEGKLALADHLHDCPLLTQRQPIACPFCGMCTQRRENFVQHLRSCTLALRHVYGSG